MDILFSDGFDSGGILLWSGSYDGSFAPVVVANPHYAGNFALDCQIGAGLGDYSLLYKDLGVSYTKLYVGSYARFSALPTIDNSRGTTISAWKTATTDGAIEAGLINITGVLNWDLTYATNALAVNHAYTAAPIVVDNWYWIEIYWIAHASNGSVGLYVNGDKVIEVTGLANDNAALQPQTVVAGAYTEGTGYATHNYFDKYIAANDHIGPEHSGLSLTHIKYLSRGH